VFLSFGYSVWTHKQLLSRVLLGSISVQALTERDDRSLKTISSICYNWFYRVICVGDLFYRDSRTYMPKIAIVEVKFTLPTGW